MTRAQSAAARSQAPIISSSPSITFAISCGFARTIFFPILSTDRVLIWPIFIHGCFGIRTDLSPRPKKNSPLRLARDHYSNARTGRVPARSLARTGFKSAHRTSPLCIPATLLDPERVPLPIAIDPNAPVFLSLHPLLLGVGLDISVCAQGYRSAPRSRHQE